MPPADDTEPHPPSARAAGEELQGIVSIGDLVNWVIQAQSTAIQQLETYITGYPTEH